jgi:MMP 1-O-methyltransferase
MQTLMADLSCIIDYINVATRFGHVSGYLQNVEGYALMELAATGPGVGAVVEIGSFMGRSTCWLAAGAQRSHREKVTAIDHFAGSPEHQPGQGCESQVIRDEGSTFRTFKANIEQAGVADHVQPIVASSEEAAKTWNAPIRLLFIDGDHSYEAARLDFGLWSPFVVPGGVIAFHDVEEWPGVTRFYRGLISVASGYTEAFRIASLAVVVKAGQ